MTRLNDNDLDQVSGGFAIHALTGPHGGFEAFTLDGKTGSFTYHTLNDGSIGMIYRDNNHAIAPVHFVNGLLVQR